MSAVRKKKSKKETKKTRLIPTTPVFVPPSLPPPRKKLREHHHQQKKKGKTHHLGLQTASPTDSSATKPAVPPSVGAATIASGDPADTYPP